MGLQKQHLIVNDEQFEHYYLCNYRLQSTGSDNLSKSLLRFKSCWDLDVAAWAACSVMELSKIPFNKDFLILRVLHSFETKIENSYKTPLDQLGLKIAKKYNGRYEPYLLHKTRKTQRTKSLTKSERIEELQDTYTFTPPDADDYRIEILILDVSLQQGRH